VPSLTPEGRTRRTAAVSQVAAHGAKRHGSGRTVAVINRMRVAVTRARRVLDEIDTMEAD
jgi:hypothetical protein